jgi:hypothetical protein
MNLASAAKNLFVHNALLRRYRCSVLRPSQLWVYVTIYVAVIILILFVNYNIRQAKDDPIIYKKYYSALYYQFLALQTLLLLGWATINSRAAMRQEVFDKTYDFFRLLPLSAMQKTVGILVGKNLAVLLLAAVTFVLIVTFGILGRVSVSLQLQVILLMTAATLFANSAALLSSGAGLRKQARMSIAAWILMFMFIGPLLAQLLFLPFIAMSQIRKADLLTVAFYRLDILILVLISLIFLYFSIWCVLGILRRFTCENEPLFTRLGAVIFLIGYELIVLGLFFSHFKTFQMAVHAFWLASLVPVVFVPLASVKTFDAYLEHCGLVRGAAGSRKSMPVALFTYSNLTLVFVLFAIWAVFAVITGRIGMLSQGQILFDVAVVLSFCLFLLLLLELHVLYSPVFSKIGLLLAFISILYLFLPIILWATIDNTSLYYYSLFGFFAHLFNPLHVKTIAAHSPVLISNLVLCIIPIVLVSKRYLYILRLRKKM